MFDFVIQRAAVINDGYEFEGCRWERAAGARLLFALMRAETDRSIWAPLDAAQQPKRKFQTGIWRTSSHSLSRPSLPLVPSFEVGSEGHLIGGDTSSLALPSDPCFPPNDTRTACRRNPVIIEDVVEQGKRRKRGTGPKFLS